MKQLDLFDSQPEPSKLPKAVALSKGGVAPEGSKSGSAQSDLSVDLIALEQLAKWQKRGWIRSLDVSLARFISELDQQADGRLLILAALVSHQLGRSHVCLSLSELVRDADSLLGLPPEDEFGVVYSDRPSDLLKGIGLADWLNLLDSANRTLIERPDSEPSTPGVLVLHSNRIYLKRLWNCEQGVIQLLKARISTPVCWSVEAAERFALNLERLFPAQSDLEPDWQKQACANSARRKISVITGGPGTGKTTTVVKLLALLSSIEPERAQPLEIALAAPTGKAAARLTESISGAVGKLPDDLRSGLMAQDRPIEVKTLHRLLGASGHTRHFKYGKMRPLPFDWVIVDEASMVDLEMFQSLLEALGPECGLVLLGDKDQLSSVEAGSVLGDLCADHLRTDAHFVTQLLKSHRFDSHSGIGLLAAAVNAGQANEALALLQSRHTDLAFPAIRLDAKPGEVLERLWQSASASGHDWAECMRLVGELPASGPEREQALQVWAAKVLNAFAKLQVLSPLRAGEWGVKNLNELIASQLRSQGLLAEKAEWHAGRPVILLQNDYSVGLMNGDVGMTLNVAEQGQTPVLKVAFAAADGTVRWVRPSRLSKVQTAFAMTVHKSQGSEFVHAALVMPPFPTPVLSRELVYTAITRAKKQFTLLAADQELLRQAVNKKTSRAGGLAEGLKQT